MKYALDGTEVDQHLFAGCGLYDYSGQKMCFGGDLPTPKYRDQFTHNPEFQNNFATNDNDCTYAAFAMERPCLRLQLAFFTTR